MVNCNPETVSTDYDTSDRLYFEPLTLEDVLGVCEVEQPEGVIVQFGGQTPLKLAAGPGGGRRPAPRHLRRRDRPRRGPRPLRPAARRARLRGAALRDRALAARRRSREAPGVGFPLLVRPSLRARRPRDGDRLLARRACATTSTRVGSAHGAGKQIFLDRFLEDSIEVDVDALCDGEDVWIGGHHAARRGGRHPLRRLAPACCRRTRSAPRCSRRSARTPRGSRKALGVVGLINVQYAIDKPAGCT